MQYRVESARMRDAIRQTACRMWNQGLSNPHLFLKDFKEHHGTEIEIEDLWFGFDQWVSGEGSKAMKRVGKDARDVSNGRQLTLPMNLGALDVASSVQIERGWVPLWATDAADLDAYTIVLQDNVNACRSKLVHWIQFVKIVKPVLKAHPRWNTGEALRWLCEKEKVPA